jgi:hypothetical protein
LNGQLHRTDGPARIHFDGYQEWWVDGKRHREDGPALVWHDGRQDWFIKGRELTQQEVELHRFRRWAVEGELV